jgi:NitT/TauT family transport system substrate-binding protein
MQLGRRSALALAGATVALGGRPARAAGKLTLGMLHTLSPAPFYLAQERGYFRDAGVEVAFRFFQAAQPISAAAVAGDIDLGVTALTGGFFALAGKGELKVIGGALREKQGYHLSAVLASKQAYEGGLTSLKQLGGHSFGITQYGSSFHYMAGQLAAAEGFDLKSLVLRPLQGVANMVAAVRSGQVDATIAIASMALPAEASGDAKIIGWISDVMPSYQITALFASGAALKRHPAEVRDFCRGYQKGIADFRAAFLRFDAAHKPIHDATTDRAIADLTRYVFTGDPRAAAKIEAGIGWYDAGGALDTADVRHQLAWYEAQGMVKGKVDADAIIDTGFMPKS